MIKKWFTLIEMALVIGIISIMFLSSQKLFTNNNQYLINSEVCINTINGKLSQVFYQAVTGKNQYNSWTSTFITPDEYNIVVYNSWWVQESHIAFYAKNSTSSTLIDNIFISWSWSSIPSCNANSYRVILSWENIWSPTNAWTNITINKHFSNTTNTPGIRICAINSTDYENCINTTPIFSSTIEYRVCPKAWQSVDTSQCKHTFSTRFDTATQSIKENKCLDITYDSDCIKWSSRSWNYL